MYKRQALALLDLDPVYLPRPWWAEKRLTSTISPEYVEKALAEHPEIKTVCITSVSYTHLDVYKRQPLR